MCYKTHTQSIKVNSQCVTEIGSEKQYLALGCNIHAAFIIKNIDQDKFSTISNHRNKNKVNA